MGAWAVVGALALALVAAELTQLGPRQDLTVYLVVQFGFGFLLKATFAAAACRFFAESRRTGALELLLCTPLTDRDITSGQVNALWRNFRWPFIAFATLMLAPAIVHCLIELSQANFNSALTSLVLGGHQLIYCACTALDLTAVCWLGMWLSLSLRKPHLAPASTIFLVLILPSVLCYFSVFTDVLFIAWGMGKLQQDLRWRIAQQFHPPPLQLVAPARA